MAPGCSSCFLQILQQQRSSSSIHISSNGVEVLEGRGMKFLGGGVQMDAFTAETLLSTWKLSSSCGTFCTAVAASAF